MRSHRSKTGSGQPEEAHASFLFVVNELPVNEDMFPRADENGRWLPPMSRAGFSPQIPGTMFRWREGSITSASANGYQWYNGNGWVQGNIPLTLYRTTSMFWCNEWTQFLTTDGDVSTRDMGSSPIPQNRWYPLTFDHDGTLSRVGEAFEDQYLAGTGARWMGQLGLSSHDPHDAPQSTGLAGNLATVIGLVAFSCRAANLDAVLLNDRAWRHYDWRGHNREHGRELYSCSDSQNRITDTSQAMKGEALWLIHILIRATYKAHRTKRYIHWNTLVERSFDELRSYISSLSVSDLNTA